MSIYGLDFGLEDLDMAFIPDNDIDWESDDDNDDDDDSFQRNDTNQPSKSSKFINDTIGFDDSSSKKKQHNDNTGKFKFVEFGKHPQPFHELLHNLSELKKTYFMNRTKGKDHRSYHKSSTTTKTHHNLGGSKSPKRVTAPGRIINMFDIKEYQKTKVLSNNLKNKTISQFHPKEPKWNGTKSPDPKMLKDLYRTPQSDPSGKLIKSLSRDEAKGCKGWKAVESDRDIPTPTPNMCSITFQRMLSKHLDDVIDKIQSEYDLLPHNTQAKSNLKARVGADLNNLVRQREEIQRALSQGIHHEDLEK